MAHDPKAYVALAQMAMGASQRELAEMLHVSPRTVQRWGGGGMSAFYLPELARLVMPHDEALAREIAAAGGATLEALGFAPPPPLPAASPAAASSPSTDPPDGIVDAVVCAAAEALDMRPADVRPGLLAAFARAREIGTTVTFVEKVLREKLAPPPPPAPKKPAK